MPFTATLKGQVWVTVPAKFSYLGSKCLLGIENLRKNRLPGRFFRF